MTSPTSEDLKIANTIFAGVLGIAIGIGSTLLVQGPKTEKSAGIDGYYDPVNKVMCYWLKDSKATPACLVVDWPYEVEGTGDEEYYKRQQEAENATYHY